MQFASASNFLPFHDSKYSVFLKCVFLKHPSYKPDLAGGIRCSFIYNLSRFVVFFMIVSQTARFFGKCVQSDRFLLCGNKMPTRYSRGFYCISYCLLNMFRASLCPSSGAQEYFTVVAACGISCCCFQVAVLLWS